MGKLLNAVNHVLKNGYEYETSSFGARKDPFSGNDSYHYGEDIISSRYGTDYILAFQDGIVSAMRNSITGFSKTNSSGNYIFIDHAESFQTRYLHLKKDSLKVKVGQAVKKGDVIAFMGTTGYSTGNHIHFEVRQNGSPLNPVSFLTGDKDIPIVVSKSDTTKNNTVFSIGDMINFSGGYHYSNAQATAPVGGKQSAGKAKITGLAEGKKHPYHLIGVSGGSNVYGWVDAATINADSQKAETTKLTVFHKGDVVKIKAAAKWYSGHSIPSWVIEDTWIVFQDQIGDRVVINANTSKRNAIMSPIHAKDLVRV